MNIEFGKERLEQVLENHEKFWKGELDRPLISITKRVKSIENEKTPLLSQANCHDFSISPEEIAERMEQELSCFEYLGDAYPKMDLKHFGPGVVAAFCGAKLDNSSGRVWFSPNRELPIEELHIKYDPQNKWAVRIKDIIKAGQERWGDNVIIGFPHMGGTLDILASFRNSAQLLFDLCDDPDEVKRLVDETHQAWLEAYEDIASVLENKCYGYTDWDGVLSKQRSYVLQCDFGYMIGNARFREFALKEIEQTAKWLGRCMFHLDGMENLANLEDLLKIDEIGILQWVPEEGNPHGACWVNEYKKILDAGKRAHVVGTINDFEEVVQALGTAKNLYFASMDNDITEEMLKKYGF